MHQLRRLGKNVGTLLMCPEKWHQLLARAFFHFLFSDGVSERLCSELESDGCTSLLSM